MYYDEGSDKVNLQNKTEGESLLLANGSSGFLGALLFESFFLMPLKTEEES